MQNDHEMPLADGDRVDDYRVLLADGSDQGLLVATARLLVATAQRGEAVGLPMTITEDEYRDQLARLTAEVERGNAGLAVAVTRSGDVIATAQWTRSKYQTQQVLAEVDRVTVLPARRGGGLAGELVTAVCEHAQAHGIEVFNLTVRGNNHAAIALYERLGFHRAGLLPGVVAIGSVRHDVVLMCRVVDRPSGLDLLGSLPAGGGASLPRGLTQGSGWERTERLLLCRPTPADVEAHYAIHADPETNLHSPTGPDTDPAASEAQLHDWVDHWRVYGYGYWTVRDPADGSVLGFGGVRPPVPGREFLNLAYRFRPSAWGKGYATELGQAALVLAARLAPGLPVVAQIRPSNLASIRVAERLGLRLEDSAQSASEGFVRYSLPK